MQSVVSSQDKLETAVTFIGDNSSYFVFRGSSHQYLITLSYLSTSRNYSFLICKVPGWPFQVLEPERKAAFF